MTNSQVFLDANTLVYALDSTSDQNPAVVSTIQRLLDEGATLCTSHHVIEEVLHIVRKISRDAGQVSKAVKEINKIPNLVLIEPDANLDFAKRYIVLVETLKMGVNDALLLQLMLDAGITRLLSYDKHFKNCAAKLRIEQVT